MSRAACDCPTCRESCHGLPGWFLPGEAAKAAAHLGLSFPAFYRDFLVTEYRVGEGPDGGDIDVLAPAKVDQRPGERASWASAFSPGRCRLLDDAGCRLPLDLRPTECAAYTCKGGKVGRRAIGEEWDTAEGRAEIAVAEAADV